MKKLLTCAVLLLLTLSVQAESPSTWLDLLNAQPGRAQPLTQNGVRFSASDATPFEGLVAAGFRQSDGSYTLGSLIWQGKVWSPLAGMAQVLSEKGFAEADDSSRLELFLALLQSCNGGLGIHVYNGKLSREENRPQPLSGSRQADGQHRFVVWFCEEPGTREGPEWRQVIYLINPEVPAIKARTVATYHPAPEGLRDFPPIPSAASE